MIFDFPGVTAIVAVGILGGYLARRTRHSERSLVRWIGAPLAGLLALASLVALGVVLRGYWKLNRHYDNPVSSISVELTPERIARGERLARICAGCHAADQEPPLEGQDFLGDGEAPPIGRMYAPNLTPIHLGGWSDGEIIRAIREGIHKNGRSLLIMPASSFRHFSDEDVMAIVAYLRSQPAVEPDTPPLRLNVLGAVLVNIAPIFEAQAPITEPVLGPPGGVTREYGGYLASLTCMSCHGEDLGGNLGMGAPGLIGVGLTWNEDAFRSFFETGIKPDGSAVDGDRMPWEELRSLFDEDELRAIWLYLQDRFAASGG